jgi:hypothetical protein
MLSAIRNRLNLSPATVIAVAALVLAMSGGAYAANRFLITSTKQISPKVLNKLKGAAGTAGAKGANGAPGAAGPAGPASAGPPGAQGAPGATGAAGKEGPSGKEGKAGKEGSPWTAAGKLPKGATETGAWIVDSASEHPATTSISFPIPLAAALSEAHVFFIPEGEAGTLDPEQCPGSVVEPTAAPGDLCVYTRILQAPLKPFSPPIWNPTDAEGAGGAASTGATIVLESTGTDSANAYGTWAVTAP